MLSKILVKIVRENDKYSIITNYTTEELKNMGYTVQEIRNMGKISIYDEILSDPDLETLNKEYILTCNETIDAKKLVEEIITAKTGKNYLERKSDRIKNVVRLTKNIAIATVGTIGTVKKIYDEYKNL